MRPRLIVTTGFPSCGKSTYSKYLEKEHDFCRLSSDDLREKIWGCGFMDPEYQNDKEALNRKEYVLGNVMDSIKYENLISGKDVVIDSTASREEFRYQLFNTNLYNNELDVERILLYIRANQEQLDIRNKARGRTKVWTPDFKEPEECDYYKLITFDNNDEIQRAENIKKLDDLIRSC